MIRLIVEKTINTMRKYLRDKLHRLAQYLEIIVALIIFVMIAISIMNMVIHIALNPLEIQGSEAFYKFMNDALSLIIGIEFLKMIIVPTSDNIIETLMFAVARHVILDQELSVMIIGVASVAILFFIKKYLYSTFEEIHTYNFRGKTKIEFINRVAGLNLPIIDGRDRIGEYLIHQLKEEDRPINAGEKIKVNDKIFFIINRMSKENKIKNIELVIDSRKINRGDKLSEQD